ncbi:MAG: sugar ABC transporter permease [Acidimicrobiia bacterium]|nr:sugar ABC transporter permease [Acidimicrobiia bacterium]
MPTGIGVDDAGATAPLITRRSRRRETLLAYTFLGPSLLVFGVFVFYPLVRTVWLGFFLQDPFGLNRSWVGFEQYGDVLTSEGFRNSVEVTVVFGLFTVPTSLALGLVLAVLSNQHLPGMRIFRTIFASTVATSVAVASLLWLVLLQPSAGLFNTFLDAIGQDAVDLLNDPDTALMAVAATTVWQNLGVVFIVALAAMQSIPEELYESASVDGHGVWSRFWNITLPLLGPQMLFLSVVLTINAFQSFGQIDILTEGGPQESTNVLVYSLVQTLPIDPGAASAQAVVLFLIIGGLSFVQFRWLDRRVHYGR